MKKAIILSVVLVMSVVGPAAVVGAQDATLDGETIVSVNNVIVGDESDDVSLSPANGATNEVSIEVGSGDSYTMDNLTEVVVEVYGPDVTPSAGNEGDDYYNISYNPADDTISFENDISETNADATITSSISQDSEVDSDTLTLEISTNTTADPTADDSSSWEVQSKVRGEDGGTETELSNAAETEQTVDMAVFESAALSNDSTSADGVAGEFVQYEPALGYDNVGNVPLDMDVGLSDLDGVSESDLYVSDSSVSAAGDATSIGTDGTVVPTATAVEGNNDLYFYVELPDGSHSGTISLSGQDSR